MAEAPVAEPQPAAQPAPVLTSIGDLDAAMAAARQSANQPAAGVESQPRPEQPSAPEPAPAEPAAPAEQPAKSQPAVPSEEAAPEAEGEEESPADPSQQPGKPSRMGRLREQLTAAEQSRRDIEARLQQRDATDAVVRQKWAALLGTADEKARLDAVLANPATPDSDLQQARTRLAQMRQASEELAPLYAAVEADVFAGFTKGLEQLRTLDGMTEASHQALYKATSGVDALRLMHDIGRKAAQEEFRGEVASLKAQVSDLKTKVAAAGAQPATPGGSAPGSTKGLGFQVDERGFPTEEAIALAKAGGLRHLGQTAAA